MSLFNRQNSTVPPELQPYYDGNNSGRGVVAWVVRLVLLVIIIGLLVVGGIWLAHRGDDTTKTPAKKATTSQTKSPSKPKSTTSQPAETGRGSSTATNGSTSAPATSSPTSTSGTTSTTAQPTSIPDTGPGQTVGLFSVVTVSGVVIYQIVLRKRTKQAA
jgi:cytoskeletal protein RodZ